MARRGRGDRFTKRLDRFAGVPVVFALGLLRKPDPGLSRGFESRCRQPACLHAIEIDEVIAAARYLLRSAVRH